MMESIREALLAPSNNGAIAELARQFGISEDQARGAVGELAPALARGIERNTQTEPGLNDLLEALRTGNHARYIEEPAVLAKPETVDDGNGILGHIFGSKEVSREVASRASASTGLSSAVLKKMLPVVASLVMGSLSKRVLGGTAGSVSKGASGLVGMLLDRDKDGSIWDDVLGMAARSMLR